MPSTVKPIPEGYHTVTPYLTVKDAAAAIRFLEQAFGAEATETIRSSDGSVSHAEVRIGTSMIMLGQSRHEWTPSAATLYLYVEDSDSTYRQALAAGARSFREPTDMFYGDRHGAVRDSDGNTWWIATHKEDVSAEELQRRAQAAGR